MQSASGAVPAGRVRPTLVERAARRAGRLLGRFDVVTARIRPWMVLAPLTLLSWGVIAYVAHSAVHNGTLYYDGGDGTWYYTTAWELAHFHIPYANISYGYPLLLAPIAGIAGPNLLAGLPLVIVLNALVLTPVALLCVYGIAKILGGRRFAYLVSCIWVAAPLLAIQYFLIDYHRRYVGQTLPAVVGLTTLGDFPSMVLLLVAAYFGLRAIVAGGSFDALASGLAVGLTLAVKPANAIFLPAPLLAFAIARRPKPLVVFGAGIVPAVVCLAVWKYRGLGELPLFTHHAQALALGPGSAPLALTVHLSKYLPFSWNKFAHNIDGFREFTWSRRMIEWSIIAGLVGLGRRSLALAGLFGAWLAFYVVLKGGSVADFYGGSYFRYLAPAFPAAFFLAMSLPFLLPILGPKLAARGNTEGWPDTPRSRRWVIVAGLVLAAGPLLPLAFIPRQTTATATSVPSATQFIPSDRFSVSAAERGGRVSLSWPRESAGGARVRYAIFRAPIDQLKCNTFSGAPVLCAFPTAAVKIVAPTAWTDDPGAGTWVYRVMVISGPTGPFTTAENDIMLSRPLTVDVPA